MRGILGWVDAGTVSVEVGTVVGDCSAGVGNEQFERGVVLVDDDDSIPCSEMAVGCTVSSVIKVGVAEREAGAGVVDTVGAAVVLKLFFKEIL